MELISPQPNRILPTTRMWIPSKVLLNDELVVTEKPVIAKKTEDEDFLKKPLAPKYWPNLFGIGFNLNNLFNGLLGCTKKPK